MDDGPREAAVRSSPRLRAPISIINDLDEDVHLDQSTSMSLSMSMSMSPPPRSSKEKKPPSITPRKFNAFFARRATRSTTIGDTTRALGAITGSAINRRQRCLKDSPIPLKQPLGPSLRGAGGRHDNDNDNDNDTPRQIKRRKTGHHTPPASSPLKPPPLFHSSSPCARNIDDSEDGEDDNPPKPALLSPLQSLPASSQVTEDISDFDCDHSDDDDDQDVPLQPPNRLTPLPHRGMAAQLLQRELGGMPRGGCSFLTTPSSDWRSETANFRSTHKDIHLTTSHDGHPRCIPFCAAACNTNSLVAIGDEEGRVRLLDVSPAEKFNNIHLSFQTHNNAIIDLAFSEDDSRLATASGDQTGKVVDMMTQTTLSVLSQHTASLKQVRFQPGASSGSVLATSSRDGSIQIWDLRCHGGPIADTLPTERHAGLRFSAPRPITSGCAVNSFFAAHDAMPRHQTRSVGLTSTATATADHADIASRGEVPGRISDVSVTAIHWLPGGRSHLLLSACEADASIKLWDVRAIHTSRHHRAPTPLGYTAPPTAHTAWRHFGISSLSLSSDATRLYALCKDNTVYAYSTSHMVLGPAGSELKRPRHAPAEQLPGPLYGFRHANFHATSFYVKSALRPSRDGRSEMLAVGSADGSPVLFPTDERYFRQAMRSGAQATGADAAAAATLTTSSHLSRTTRAPMAKRPATLSRPGSVSGIVRAVVKEDIPIIRSVDGVSYGAPLVRGHTKEVGALAWTRDGSLVTVSDDYLVRCWREDDGGGKARDLRVGGEGEGRRWGCGWASVEEEWDADEEGEWEE